MCQLVKLARNLNKKLIAVSFISMAPINHNLKEREEANQVLSKLSEIIISDIVIHERKICRDAMAEGKGVVEYNNYKASNEMNNLFEKVSLYE